MRSPRIFRCDNSKLLIWLNSQLTYKFGNNIRYVTTFLGHAGGASFQTVHRGGAVPLGCLELICAI